MTPLQRAAIIAALFGVPLLGAPAAPIVAALPELAATPALLKTIASNRAAARRIDVGQRVANWGGGSCVHASLVHLLHWQGQHELAENWRKTHSGGEYPDSIDKQMDDAGLPYAETRNSDVKFLEWAVKTRRGANVRVQNGKHMVTLVGLDKRYATILDSNDRNKTHKQPRAEFLKDWKTNQSGTGWAFTTLFEPPPPKPWTIKPEDVK